MLGHGAKKVSLGKLRAFYCKFKSFKLKKMEDIQYDLNEFLQKCLSLLPSGA